VVWLAREANNQVARRRPRRSMAVPVCMDRPRSCRPACRCRRRTACSTLGAFRPGTIRRRVSPSTKVAHHHSMALRNTRWARTSGCRRRSVQPPVADPFRRRAVGTRSQAGRPTTTSRCMWRRRGRRSSTRSCTESRQEARTRPSHAACFLGRSSDSRHRRRTRQPKSRRIPPRVRAIPMRARWVSSPFSTSVIS
jgi:hypothetical protein